MIKGTRKFLGRRMASACLGFVVAASLGGMAFAGTGGPQPRIVRSASAPQQDGPVPVTYELRWRIYDPCDCPNNADGYVEVQINKRSQGIVFGTAKGDFVHGPETRVVTLACENSKPLCKALTKPHNLRGGPLP